MLTCSNCVLVVEDDPALGPLIHMVLSTHGFEVLPATTAVEALRLWEQAERAVSVALIDLTLPGETSGEALAKQLKRDKPSLNLIVTSGRLLWPEDSLDGFRDFTYLQKPFLPAELVRVIRDAFEKVPGDAHSLD